MSHIVTVQTQIRDATAVAARVRISDGSRRWKVATDCSQLRSMASQSSRLTGGIRSCVSCQLAGLYSTTSKVIGATRRNWIASNNVMQLRRRAWKLVVSVVPC